MTVAILSPSVSRPLSDGPLESTGTSHLVPLHSSALTSRWPASSCRGNAARPLTIRSDHLGHASLLLFFQYPRSVLSTAIHWGLLSQPPTLWPTKATVQHRHESLNHIYSPTSTISSSGQSSPLTSDSSSYFSPPSSTSSRSTPSSQNSYTSASPQPPQFLRRQQPRIQVSSLLAPSNTRSYHLEVVQHPRCTAEFGSASLSRLPLTPPVIVRLIVRDPSGNSFTPEAELPFLIAHLSLLSADGSTSLDVGSAPGGDQSPPILYGNLVSSVHQLEDLQGNMGLFFLFPDVSIRFRGRFRLRVNLMRLYAMDPLGRMSMTPQSVVLADTITEPFDVVAVHEYRAAPLSRLTQCFLRQGARMFTHMSSPHS